MNTTSARGIRRFFKRQGLKVFKKFARDIEGDGAMLLVLYSPWTPEEEGHLLVMGAESSPETKALMELQLMKRLKVSLQGEEIPEKETKMDKDPGQYTCPECGGALTRDKTRTLVYCMGCDYGREITPEEMA